MQISRLELNILFDLSEFTEQTAVNCTVDVTGENL